MFSLGLVVGFPLSAQEDLGTDRPDGMGVFGCPWGPPIGGFPLGFLWRTLNKDEPRISPPPGPQREPQSKPIRVDEG